MGVLPFALVSVVLCQYPPALADTLETFDAGTVTLLSYPGEDMHPDSWRLDSLITYAGSPRSLRLSGNTWKVENTTPRMLDTGTVWQVAAYVESLGEIAGFVLSGGNDTLLYSFAGTEQLDPCVEAWYERAPPFARLDGAWSVTCHFHCRVTDPDSRWHRYYCNFGDDSTSADSAPIHTYTVRDNHDYTVLLEVEDSTRLVGRTVCRVRVEPGPSRLPVVMNFIGDCMLTRRYENPGGIIDTIGPEGLFESILPWLGRVADITVANLESPLTASGMRHPTKPLVFRGRPGNIRSLTHAGINVVSLANNHVIDYGLVGMRETLESLAGRGIAYSGAGANSYEASQPVFLQSRGICIAFVSAATATGSTTTISRIWMLE